jgi:tetratricopeptide (TPR) repeat protein
MNGSFEKPYLPSNKNLSENHAIYLNAGQEDINVEMGRAVKIHRSGNLQKAQEMYQRILADYPDHAQLHYLLGLIAYQSGNHTRALDYITKAINCDPYYPIYYNGLGDVFKAQGDLKKATACYQKAVQLEPDSVEANFNLGSIHHDQLQFEEAIYYFLKTVQVKPDLTEAHYNTGLAYQAMDKLDEAIASYDKAIHIKPDYPEAHNNKGKALKDKGDLEAALTCFQRAIQLKQDFAEPYFNLGDVLATLGKMEAAIENYRLALRYRPNMIEAYNNLANVLKKRGDLDAAIENYRQVLRLKPDLAEAHYNLGSTLRLKEAFGEATAHLQQALQLKAGYAEAYNNLGLTYKEQGNLDQAIESFSRALQIKPQLAEAHWNRSFTYLLNANFRDGWPDYEWRFQQARWKTLYPHRYNGPRWDGKTCPDKTIFIHDEQGLGDTLQFVRYIPAVKSHCRKVIFETRKSLIPLLQGFPGIDRFIIRSAKQPVSENWDFYTPLLSLPKIFGTDLETIPADGPYINADAGKVAYWGNRLTGRRFKVGIVWAGRPLHTNDRNRSCKLNQFYPFSKIPGIQLIGLQKGDAAAQTQHMPEEIPLTNYGEEFEDFSDTAGLIENLDLVISVDTAVAHLAGAMGKPVWVLLPFVPDWRWMMDREDSPWYPTMRLFRQKTHGDWGPVFQRVGKELKGLKLD